MQPRSAPRRPLPLAALWLAAAVGALLFAAPAHAQRFFSASPASVTDEIAVDFVDDVSSATIASLGRRLALSFVPNSSRSEADALHVAKVAAADVSRVLAQLRSDPSVEFAEPMATYRVQFEPNDPLYTPLQWHLRKVESERAWDYTCGSGVVVAVIDTGIACFDKGPFSRGSDLQGTRCRGGFNFINKLKRPSDDHGHGTHVAGTIAQTTHNRKGVAGVAFCAELMPIKVLSSRGYGRTTDIAQGIRFAADKGADVINLSLGGPFPSKILKRAVEYAISKGVVVVAAAGNSGGWVGYPAAYPGVIAVSATDSNDRIASFSSRGKQVVLAAPGVDVTQQTVCEEGLNHCELFGTFSGTSMASPHVAGAAALLKSLGVTDPRAVRAALTSGAHQTGAPATTHGAGRLDAGNTVATLYRTRVAWRLGVLGVLLVGLGRYLRRKKTSLRLGSGALFAAMATSVGVLFFLPWLGLRPASGATRAAAEWLMRPLPEWDLMIGAGLHANLPLSNAAIPLLLALFGFGRKRLRPVIGGLSVGMAAYLIQMAVAREVNVAGGLWVTAGWFVVNAAVCLWLARICLDSRHAD